MAVAFAWALVASNGSTTSAQNIASCKHAGTGSYMVTYKKPFTASPGVQATPMGAGGITASLNIMAMNMCEVFTWDTNGRAVDAPFSFLAVGDA
jgi:hypothetical protein